MIESRQRRRDREPYNANATEESGGPEGGKSTPDAQIDHRDPGKRQRHRERRRLEMDMDCGMHRRAYWSTAEREASRAGVCADGCKVFKNATSAVVSGGLRFFP